MFRKTLRSTGAQPRRQRELEVLSNFRRLYRTTRGLLSRRPAPGSVSPSQILALSKVAQAPGLRVSDLARDLAVRPSTVSNLLLRLEQGGLVRRRRRGKDRREVGVYLTRRGGTAVHRASRDNSRYQLDHSLAELPEPALHRLDASLAALLDLISRALGEKQPANPGSRTSRG